MTESEDVAQWIQALSAPDEMERRAAATKLYLRGMMLFASAEAKLGASPEFQDLILQRGSDLNERLDNPLPTIVGVAVTPSNFEKIRIANGSPALANVPPDQDAIEFEFELDKQVVLDILTTREANGEGAMARFLRKSGEGIQQIERYVRDVDRATDILRRAFGLQPVYPATRAGANGTRVNFFLVPTEPSGKVLIELVEAKEPA